MLSTAPVCLKLTQNSEHNQPQDTQQKECYKKSRFCSWRKHNSLQSWKTRRCALVVCGAHFLVHEWWGMGMILEDTPRGLCCIPHASSLGNSSLLSFWLVLCKPSIQRCRVKTTMEFKNSLISPVHISNPGQNIRASGSLHSSSENCDEELGVRGKMCCNYQCSCIICSRSIEASWRKHYQNRHKLFSGRQKCPSECSESNAYFVNFSVSLFLLCFLQILGTS